jgi:purine-nucleoside phosphorylase
MTVHIESNKEDISRNILMPGDPKRCEYIAKNYLQDYKIVNNVRGMTAYTGYYKGKRITIFPSGMGIPSMGIYSYELYKYYDVENIIRIGSCGGYNHTLKLKDIILVDNSYSQSTYAKYLDGYQDNLVKSTKNLNDIILKTSNELNMNIIKGTICSTDVFYEKDYKNKPIEEYNILGAEMESFALFNNARTLGKNAACLLTVSDLFFSEDKLTSLEREQNLNEMIVLALESCLKL